MIDVMYKIYKPLIIHHMILLRGSVVVGNGKCDCDCAGSGYGLVVSYGTIGGDIVGDIVGEIYILQ